MLRLISLIAFVTLNGTPLSSDELPLRRNTGQKQTLLVLNSGRVVSGQLTPRTGGYDVQLPAGRMFVGSQQVRLQAHSMDDAYRRMRSSLNEHTPNTHMELAKWCLANKMSTQARSEVLDALHLDPNRDDAKRMLEALMREQHRASTGTDPRQTIQNGHRSYNSVTLVHPSIMPERRSLGGLPKSLAKTFSQTVQPIVVNKCGNARCHGVGQNTFTVFPINGGSTSRIAEQNLAAMLNQIDLENPSQSPLLQATKGNHGNSRRMVFAGQTGGRQAATLRTWVTDVAREISPSSAAFETQVDQPTTGTTAADSPTPRALMQSTPGGHRAAEKETFVRDAVVATRHDEFNPELFNQRYHKSTALNESRFATE
ncbi:MAG: hypothetical protein P8J37_13430 [Fuerstiella sp.]|nr:hypothetical protein [Fuerstiella sp.]